MYYDNGGGAAVYDRLTTACMHWAPACRIVDPGAAAEIAAAIRYVFSFRLHCDCVGIIKSHGSLTSDTTQRSLPSSCASLINCMYSKSAVGLTAVVSILHDALESVQLRIKTAAPNDRLRVLLLQLLLFSGRS